MTTLPRVFVYTMPDDNGFAPNPFGKELTLTCCKPIIRKTARPGDIIIGLAGKQLANGVVGKVIHAFRVDRIIGLAEYWTAYRHKRPSSVVLKNKVLQTTRTSVPRVNQVGDCCYEPRADGTFMQHLCVHSHAQDPEKMRRRDLSVHKALTSRQFIYWGRDGPIFQYYHHVQAPSGRSQRMGHKCNFDASVVRNIAGWFDRLIQTLGPGVKGPPHVWPAHDMSWKM